MTTTLEDIQTPSVVGWGYSIETHLRDLADHFDRLYSNRVEKAVSRCFGCGSSDFKGNRCMFCRRFR